MSNILFFCNYRVEQPSCGGIIRVTGTLAHIFKEKNHNCFLAYYDQQNGVAVSGFKDEIKLTKNQEKEQLSSFIKKNKICTIILQVPLNNTNWYLLPLLKNVIINSNSQCKLIHCYHSIPFAECKGFDIPYLKYMIHRKDSIKKLIWGLICLFLPTIAYYKTIPRYKRICDYCDSVVLLSDKYRHYFDGINGKSQIYGIGNPVTFQHNPISKVDIRNKDKSKSVIIVGRLDESTKRLSKAIKIWSILNREYDVHDWTLNIIGEGDDLSYYKAIVNKYKLLNINFLGKQDPTTYYKEASILMSTSAIEGFSMVILEAKQKGCVPISFDSFDAVTDVINNNIDGIIVSNNNIQEYVKQLHRLITDEKLRKQLSKNGVELANRFSEDNIYNKWKVLLKDTVV